MLPWLTPFQVEGEEAPATGLAQMQNLSYLMNNVSLEKPFEGLAEVQSVLLSMRDTLDKVDIPGVEDLAMILRFPDSHYAEEVYKAALKMGNLMTFAAWVMSPQGSSFMRLVRSKMVIIDDSQVSTATEGETLLWN